MTFSVGEDLQLVLSSGLNPSQFSCQLHSNVKLLQTLMADVDLTASDISSDHPPTLSPGQSVLAQSLDDQRWYRGQVVSFDPLSGSKGMADILFVDYGSCVTVPLSSVRSLPKGFATLPRQAIACSLFGVCPSEGEDSKWIPEAMERLRELAAESKFVTGHVKRVSEANVIELSLRSDICGDFAGALVESGYAVLL